MQQGSQIHLKRDPKGPNSGGFIKLLVSIIIALIILSYFGFDLRSLMENPQTQENLNYFWNILKTIWFDYIWKGILYIWNYSLTIFSKIFDSVKK